MLPWGLCEVAMKRTTSVSDGAQHDTTALSTHVTSGPADEYERGAYPERSIPGEGRV